MISKETIDQIFAAIHIEEVIGDYVNLKRRGVNQIGLCPFHDEKTPSFTVSPAKGIYKCFGCGKAGNAVNFLMEHEHFTYPEALRYLAKKYNIEIEEKEQTPEEIQEQNEREKLFNLNQFATGYFIKTLHQTEEGKAVGLSYLRERGIREDLVEKFQLGYSPSVWDDFTKYAQEQGYQMEVLVESGLTIQKEGRAYDRFHNRVIFPIHSVSGRVIGFGGRILSSDPKRPKYVNSPESEIYNKSKSLYGIYFARNAIVSKDVCCLVEGYTDVIALHQAGIENVVASSGTSLTHDQIRMIQRYSRNITILYDGDPAGIKASFRGIDMILEEGMNVRIVLFPEGQDPDSYARSHHPDEVAAFIEQKAQNFITFKTNLLINETAGDPIKKAALIKEIVHTVALIPDGITRTLYVKECSALMDISEQVLMTEVRKVLREKFRKTLPEPEIIDDGDPDSKSPAQSDWDVDSLSWQEKEVIRLLLLYGDKEVSFDIPGDPEETDAAKDETTKEVKIRVADMMVSDIVNDDLRFENPVYQSIFAVFRETLQQEEIPSREVFIRHSDQELASTAINLMFNPYQLSENWEKNNIIVPDEEHKLKQLVITALLSFKSKKLDKMMQEKELLLQETTDPGEQNLLLETLKRLKESSIQINRHLGRIITR